MVKLFILCCFMVKYRCKGNNPKRRSGEIQTERAEQGKTARHKHSTHKRGKATRPAIHTQHTQKTHNTHNTQKTYTAHNNHLTRQNGQAHKTKAKSCGKINYRKGRATTNTEIEKLYNLAEIEEILGVTRQTLLNYIKSGQLQAVKIGGKWKVKKETLEKFMLG